MPNKSRVYNQNLIDFIIQYYGETDKVIDFLSLNDLEYDEFQDSTKYKVDPNNNSNITYFINTKQDVVSGLDTSAYTDLYVDATYYYPTTGEPTSILYPDTNIILDDTLTVDFENWDSKWQAEWGYNPFGSTQAINDTFEYQLSGDTLGVPITLGLCFTNVLKEELQIGTYDVTFRISALSGFTGATYLGGFVGLAENNELFILRDEDITGRTYTHSLELVQGDEQFFKNEMWFYWIISPAENLITLESCYIYRTG